MHVLVLTQNNIAPARYGGALRVATLAHHLKKDGHRVSVIRFVSPGEAPSAECDLHICDVSVPRGYPMAPIAMVYHLLDRVAIRHALKLDALQKISLVQSDVPWAALTGHRVSMSLGVPHVLLSMNCETDSRAPILAGRSRTQAAIHRRPAGRRQRVGGQVGGRSLDKARQPDADTLRRRYSGDEVRGHRSAEGHSAG